MSLGSAVVERRTGDREVSGSSLTHCAVELLSLLRSIAALPLAQHYPAWRQEKNTCHVRRHGIGYFCV